MASKEKKKPGGLSVDAKVTSNLKAAAAAAPTAASNSPRPPSTAAPQRSGRRVSMMPSSASAAVVHAAVAQTFGGAVSMSAAQPAANILDIWMNAAEKGSIAFLNAQLDAKAAQGWNVDTKDRSGNTALFHACWGGQLEVVKLLLSRGAKAKHVNETRSTAAHIAVVLADKFPIHIDKYADIIRELISHGADPHAKNDHNESPASLVAHSDTLTENGGAELLKGALGLLVSSAKTTKSLLLSQPSGLEGAKSSAASSGNSGGSAPGVLSSRVSFMLPSSPPPVADGASFGFAADQGSSLSLMASTGDLAAPEIGSPTNAEQQQPRQSEVARAKHLSMLRLGYKALFAALQRYGFEPDDPDFDSNTSYLHTRNLHAGFAAMGVPLGASDVELLEKIMDIDRDGSVDEADFLKMMLRCDTERDARAALDRAFRWLDADADGAVSAADLRDSAKRVGALLHCANDRELLAIARSVASIPGVGGSGAGSSSSAAAAAPVGAVTASAAAAASAQQRLAALQLQRAHIEHMAQYVLDPELMRQMDDEETQAEVALASERARAMATSGFTMGRNRGRRTSTFITSGF